MGPSYYSSTNYGMDLDPESVRMSALRDNHYFLAGKAIAVSLIHGGPPPAFFSTTLFHCLVGGPHTAKPMLEDIADPDIYQQNKVLSLDTLKVKLQIWDTAGQERFRSVTHAYYRDAHALLLLYDVTNKASFDNIRAWLTEIHEYAQQDVVVMLLGNKTNQRATWYAATLILGPNYLDPGQADSTHDRAVKKEEGEKLAKEFGVPFMETSAKSSLNVELAFIAVAKELKHRTMKEPDEPKFQLQEYVDREMRTAGCCRS